MYCKDCKFNKQGKCTSNKIDEDCGQDGREDSLIYSYYEGGSFSVGGMFGCVHFKQRECEKDE